MEEQRVFVEALRQRVADARRVVEETEVLLKAETRRLREACGASDAGHAYKEVPDDDCHNPGWHRVCTCCGYWKRR